MRVLNHAFGYRMEDEERAAMPLAGGIMQHGFQCGMIWGAALAAGAHAFRVLGPDPQAETASIVAAQRLVESFRILNGSMNCIDITGIDKTSSGMEMTMYFLIKGGAIGCSRMASKYAPVAYREITSTIKESHKATIGSSVSCSAMLARRMGSPDLHATMASGLSGGIGLSGGACGALGAAIWIIGINSVRKGAGKIDFNNPKATDTIGRFVQATGFEFECSKIVGRKFVDADDQAAYLRDGGCSKVIEALAAK